MSVQTSARLDAEQRVTGYDIVADTSTELADYAKTLGIALSYMTPSGTTATRSSDSHQAAASISMRLAAILRNTPELTGDPSLTQALRGIRFYLLHQRQAIAHSRNIPPGEAELYMLPNYAYFEQEWDDLTGGPVEL